MSSSATKTTADLERLLALADDLDRGGQPDSALSTAEHAFSMLRERPSQGFVLSARIAHAFCLRLRAQRGVAALMNATEPVVQLLDAALAADPPTDGTYDSGLELLAQLHTIAGHMNESAPGLHPLHLQTAAMVLETRRDLRRRLDGPNGSLQLVATLAWLATVLRELQRWPDAYSAATEAATCLRDLPKEPTAVTEVKSCLEALVPLLEMFGFSSEARATAAVAREVTEWSTDRV